MCEPAVVVEYWQAVIKMYIFKKINTQVLGNKVNVKVVILEQPYEGPEGE